MKTIQKIALLGVVALLSAPLAGCGGTWDGMKQDWHGMTGSSDSSDNSSMPSAQPAAQPAPAQAAAPASQNGTTLHSDTTTTTTYNQ